MGEKTVMQVKPERRENGKVCERGRGWKVKLTA